MVIKDLHWDMIKHRLSSDEKQAIKEATVARSLNPKEFILQEHLLDFVVLQKLYKCLGIKSPCGGENDVKTTHPGTSPGTPGDT